MFNATVGAVFSVSVVMIMPNASTVAWATPRCRRGAAALGGWWVSFKGWFKAPRRVGASEAK